MTHRNRPRDHRRPDDDGRPLLTYAAHGRVWRFGRPDIRPARLAAFADLADQVAAADEPSDADAIRLGAVAEDILRSALPVGDRVAFDRAPFGGAEITGLCDRYFAALGISPGESSASPPSSRGTRRR